MSKKVVVKLDLRCEKDKQKAMKALLSLPGIDSIAMDMEEKKLTVIGDVDLVIVAKKLSELCHADILSVGPAKEPKKKKEEPKKEEEKKKEEPKKEEEKKKEEPKKEEEEEKKTEEPKKEEEEEKKTAEPKKEEEEEKKKEEPKKEEEEEKKTEELKKEEEEEKKTEEPKKEEPNKEEKKEPADQIAEPVKAFSFEKSEAFCSDQKSRKVVVKLDLQDEKDKQRPMRALVSLSGIDSIAMDMKEKKLTVIGDVDPVSVIRKLRKLWHAEIVSVGPAKEPAKELKKEPVDQIAELVKAYKAYNPHLTTHYFVHSAEENPNACVIC